MESPLRLGSDVGDRLGTCKPLIDLVPEYEIGPDYFIDLGAN